MQNLYVSLGPAQADDTPDMFTEYARNETYDGDTRTGRVLYLEDLDCSVWLPEKAYDIVAKTDDLDFPKAFSFLRKGHFISRSVWPKDHFLSASTDENLGHKPHVLMVTAESGGTVPYTFTFEDMFAEDWFATD